MRNFNLFFLGFLILFILACNENQDKKSGFNNEKATNSQVKLKNDSLTLIDSFPDSKKKIKINDLNGKYKNVSNQILIISNFDREIGFEFQIQKIGIPPCEYSFKGKAVFNGANTAKHIKSDDCPFIGFVFSNNHFSLHIDFDFLGKDCYEFGKENINFRSFNRF